MPDRSILRARSLLKKEMTMDPALLYRRRVGAHPTDASDIRHLKVVFGRQSGQERFTGKIEGLWDSVGHDRPSAGCGF